MNRTQLLINAAGPDRIGFVDEITGVLLHYGANIEESRMARLAGQFAALIVATVDEEQVEPLTTSLQGLRARDMEVSARRLLGGESDVFKDYLVYEIFVTGADHEGIIRSIARQLTEMGINIAELESDVGNAPTTGTPLFNMRGVLQVPPSLPIERINENLRRAADQMSVLIRVEER